jgi:hypothetical protein
MTPRDALEILGLAEHGSADTIRRAYLRKLRAHKPERDPEGFRRVREAFELLSGGVFRVSEPAIAPEEPRAPTETTPAAPSDPMNELAQKLVVLDPLDYDGRLAIARQMVELDPANAEARWQLCDAFAAAGRETEHREALLDATRLEDGGPFVDELLEWYPGSLPDEHVARALADANAERLMKVASDLMRAGRTADAATLAERSLELAETRPDQEVPWPYSVHRLILTLYEQREPDRARALEGRYEKLVRQTGSGTRILTPHDALTATLLGELARIPTQGTAAAPPELLARIASAVGSGDLELAQPEVRKWAQANPRRAELLALELTDEAPTLSAAYGRILDPMLQVLADPAFAREEPRTERVPWYIVTFGLMAMMAAVRALPSTCSSSEPRVVPRAEPLPTTSLRDDVVLVDRVRRMAARADARPVVERICRERGAPCALARSFVDAIEAGDCRDARVLLERLPERAALEEALRKACGEPP